MSPISGEPISGENTSPISGENTSPISGENMSPISGENTSPIGGLCHCMKTGYTYYIVIRITLG